MVDGSVIKVEGRWLTKEHSVGRSESDALLEYQNRLVFYDNTYEFVRVTSDPLVMQETRNRHVTYHTIRGKYSFEGDELVLSKRISSISSRASNTPSPLLPDLCLPFKVDEEIMVIGGGRSGGYLSECGTYYRWPSLASSYEDHAGQMRWTLGGPV